MMPLSYKLLPHNLQFYYRTCVCHQAARLNGKWRHSVSIKYEMKEYSDIFFARLHKLLLLTRIKRDSSGSRLGRLFVFVCLLFI